VARVRTDVSEECIASIMRMKGSATVTANVVPSSLVLFALMNKAIHSSETSVLTRTTRHHIPEADILHSHRRETL
jgi:hypothetical protein